MCPILVREIGADVKFCDESKIITQKLAQANAIITKVNCIKHDTSKDSIQLVLLKK